MDHVCQCISGSSWWDSRVDCSHQKTRRLRDSVLKAKKNLLMKWVEIDANRPHLKHTKIVSSVAFECLRRDYIIMCQGYEGGLHIVYDKQGTGKSYALQALARAKSIVQPHRFLVINMSGDGTCQDLYKAIKDRVLGPLDNFDFTPDEVAQVIKYGLCSDYDRNGTILKKTSNNCRLSVKGSVAAIKKSTNFPILVIDEFNPCDFTWPKGQDYTTKEIRDQMGYVFEFFVALTGLAHTGDGFAALPLRCTKSTEVGRQPWQGA